MTIVPLVAVAFLDDLASWMQSFATQPSASVWLFVFAFAESSFFPIPPDALLIALCLTDSSLGSLPVALWFAAVCTVASTFGGAFGYGLGHYAGRPILERVASAERIAAVEGLLQRYDVWAVAIAGFTPIPYKVFTIASGLLHVRFVRFAVASLLSRGTRFFLVAALSYAIGLPVRTFIDDHFGLATIAFVITLAGGFWLVSHLAGRYKKRASQAGANERTS
jgi:membrane protein YqaA with SNARE-associated domain